MKTVKRAFLFIFLMGTLSRVMAQTKGTQELTVPLSEPGKPVTLIAHLVDGSIKVIGYDGKDVIVLVHIDSTKDEDNGESEGLKRINTNGGVDVRVDENDNVVHINVGMPQRRLQGLTIKVPKNTSRVDVGTVNGGDISVTDVSGKVEISNVNGAITATGISGSVVANTVNGDVVVKFKSVDEKAAMAFASLNGKIDVSLPADAKANLKLKSDNGQMYSDFDIAIDKTEPKVETNNEGHYHQIKIEDWITGKINGGGSEIMMKSTFGAVYIRKAK